MRKISSSNPKKVFDLTPYPDVREFLEKKSNMTQYVVELIRKDMNTTESVNKENIFEIIEEYLEMKNVNPNERKQDLTEEQEKRKNAALKLMKGI